MKKLFGNIKISWTKLVIYSLIIGVYVGAIMCIPFLNETSFQDIGISYEWWVLFAVILVTNCHKWYEAMIKCFLFFLISQPVIFLTEVLLNKITLTMGLYYYLKIWLPITMLTLPGGLIAYFCKKQNILGSIILGLGNTILLFLATHYFVVTYENFPYHLLSAISCIAIIIIMTLNIQNKTVWRIISFIIPVILTILMLIYINLNGLSIV